MTRPHVLLITGIMRAADVEDWKKGSAKPK